jgi:hypothetical protein
MGKPDKSLSTTQWITLVITMTAIYFATHGFPH